MKKIRVRFAPSPTGYLHIGSLRTALYDYLFARKSSGDFILKLEDTDRSRFVEGATESLIQSLDWMGLDWDEGIFQNVAVKDDRTTVIESKNYPGVLEVGDYGPYIQSEKLERYRQLAEELVEKGYAYYCFCEPERLEEVRKDQAAMKQPPMYDRYCLRNVSPDEVNEKLKNNFPHTIRLKVPKDEMIEVEDIIRGKVSFKTELVDDQVLIKSDGFPTYHLANVVDDHDMGITHVIRGEEWLSSVPKHILIYRYFGWEPPRFAHLPLLLNPDKSKLSKRQGDVAVEDYIKNGYLKEAIINFVAFLGWNPGKGETQEIYSIDELVNKFELEKVHKAGAVFEIRKLDWINSQYIKKLSLDDLYQRAIGFLKEKDFYQNAPEDRKTEEYVKKVLLIEQERLIRLVEVGESSKFFFLDIDYKKEMLRWKDMTDEDLRDSLAKAGQMMKSIAETDWTREKLEKIFMDTAGEKRGEFLWPLRVALTGEKKTPPPQEVAWVLGKDESIKRLEKSLELLG